MKEDAAKERKWAEAGRIAAAEVGFDDDEPCWDGFSITVEDKEFGAELHVLNGPGVGIVKVTDDDQGCRLFDEDGYEEEILS